MASVALCCVMIIRTNAFPILSLCIRVQILRGCRRHGTCRRPGQRRWRRQRRARRTENEAWYRCDRDRKVKLNIFQALTRSQYESQALLSQVALQMLDIYASTSQSGTLSRCQSRYLMSTIRQSGVSAISQLLRFRLGLASVSDGGSLTAAITVRTASSHSTRYCPPMSRYGANSPGWSSEATLHAVET